MVARKAFGRTAVHSPRATARHRAPSWAARLLGADAGRATGRTPRRGRHYRDLRINQMIRVFEVRVVDEDGSQLGVMRTADAMRLAQERGLDLVEVAPLASPPVARLLDFGQYKYELTKRERKPSASSARSPQGGPLRRRSAAATRHEGPTRDRVPGRRQVKISVTFGGRGRPHPRSGEIFWTNSRSRSRNTAWSSGPAARGQNRCTSASPTHKRIRRPRGDGRGMPGLGRGAATDRDRADMTNEARRLPGAAETRAGAARRH
jgi:translation initiation factor IF-3